ncbi:MAG TPA: folylpolyglutamate synthase/dihydrofolate synthase family protein [Candidatus Cybelea sp.]|jgi:dihydrofolate synthase/folylpolyglutamate synthase|nr:folylpolyglutamate synthase/dihydrofolate synthase family protein [Candidatus Cybelea sp.]
MRRVTTYEEAERYLLATIGEIVSPRTSYKLDRMRAFLNELGDPHLAYPTIHVGGTSGKGSTSTMIAGALQAAGRRTGLHTKPHLHSMTERARVDGQAVSRERFTELLDAMMPAIERTVSNHGRPTYYETLLALAFFYFAQERVDVAVIEVGLGGRLDGTNVIQPRVAAITSVGFDHTDVLGDTLEAIAGEKAGIAKRGVPLVVAALPDTVRAVIERVAAEAGAPVVNVAQSVSVESEMSGDVAGQSLTVRSAFGSYRIRLPVLGIFQRANAATAIAVIEQLGDDLRPSREALVRAFAELVIPGRMEVVARDPVVVFDIAHNAEKAESLVASLRERFGARRFHYVVAIGESKDARRIIEILARAPSTFTFTKFAIAGRRSIPPQRLAAIAEMHGTWGRTIEDPAEALTIARRRAEIDDVVVVTGSTFIVTVLREWYAPSAV